MEEEFTWRKTVAEKIPPQSPLHLGVIGRARKRALDDTNELPDVFIFLYPTKFLDHHILPDNPVEVVGDEVDNHEVLGCGTSER